MKGINTFNELILGQEINLNFQRRFDFESYAKVEALGVDWAVVRVGRKPLLLDEDDLRLVSYWEGESEDADNAK